MGKLSLGQENELAEVVAWLVGKCIGIMELLL